MCPTKSALFKHMERHKEKMSGKIKCDECDKEFTGKSSLFHHKRGMHGVEKKYKCKECGQAFNFHHSLKLHRYKHTGQRPYQCKICTKSYLTSNHLKNHVEAVHSGKKKFVCPVCNKGFTYDNSLRMHMLLHGNSRPFVCPQCGKTFVSKSALRAHEELHTSDMHTCTVCQKIYKTRMLLRAHMRRHTEEGSRYMCDICGNTFMYRSTLLAHQSVHGETRTYQCQECDKTFKTYATLYSHRLVHEDKNPHPCSVCGKGFKTRERMKAHERRHTGEKPYKCELCGSCFPDKGGLSKHNKTVHARKARFQCPTCGKLANRADNLRVHMKMHNDPKLMALGFEDLMIKHKEGEEELDMDESIPMPMPRRRRATPLKQETTIPNTSITDHLHQQTIDHLHLHQQENQNNQALNVNVGILEQQQNMGNVSGAGASVMDAGNQHAIITAARAMPDLVNADLTFIGQIPKFQQHQQQNMPITLGSIIESTIENQPIPVKSEHQQQNILAAAMQKHVITPEVYDKSLLEKQVAAMTAANLQLQQQQQHQSSNTGHTVDLHNNSSTTTDQIQRLGPMTGLVTQAGSHLHGNSIQTVQPNQQQAAIHHATSLLNNPLLQLAEVMSNAQHSHPTILTSQPVASYSQLQQYQPFVTVTSQQQVQQQQQPTTNATFQVRFQ